MYYQSFHLYLIHKLFIEWNWICGVSKLMLSGWYNILGRFVRSLDIISLLWLMSCNQKGHTNICTSVLDKDLLPILSEYFCWTISWFTLKKFKIYRIACEIFNIIRSPDIVRKCTSHLIRIFTGNKRVSYFLNECVSYFLVNFHKLLCGCGCQFQRFSVVDRRKLRIYANWPFGMVRSHMY